MTEFEWIAGHSVSSLPVPVAEPRDNSGYNQIGDWQLVRVRMPIGSRHQTSRIKARGLKSTIVAFHDHEPTTCSWCVHVYALLQYSSQLDHETSTGRFMNIFIAEALLAKMVDHNGVDGFWSGLLQTSWSSVRVSRSRYSPPTRRCSLACMRSEPALRPVRHHDQRVCTTTRTCTERYALRERRDIFVHVDINVDCSYALAKHLDGRADAGSECACSDKDCWLVPAGKEIICALSRCTSTWKANSTSLQAIMHMIKYVYTTQLVYLVGQLARPSIL